jgi:hypothetical protein
MPPIALLDAQELFVPEGRAENSPGQAQRRPGKVRKKVDFAPEG